MLCSKSVKVSGTFAQSVEVSTKSQGRKTPRDVIRGFPKAGFLKSKLHGLVAQF